MLEKSYDFKAIEPTIYKRWLPHLKIERQKGKRTITFLMAPPNITGVLHLGHSLENTLVDILARYHRMRGWKVVWLPGIDHAGIAAQNVVEKDLRKRGQSRFQLGRKKFVEAVWAWKETYGSLILDQFRQLGITPDWSRTRFTLDPAYVRQVERAFVKYHQKGLVYRALRTITWCPRCRTSISDLEIDHADETTSLYYITYGPLTIATVRPETKFGDTAIAVHPRDERYQQYVGQELEVSSLDTTGSLEQPRAKKIKIKVIADEAVDPAFGTGVIKVTPAHDITDYEIALRHHLPLIQIIDETGRMNERAGKYAGLKTKEARIKILQDLRALGLVTKEEQNAHRVSVCSRCATILEPLPSLQWFVRMRELARLAGGAVRQKKTAFVPARWRKPYAAWLINIRDWCVSRQLWWGQVMPVWFCVNCGESSNAYRVSLTAPRGRCSSCRGTNWVRTTEVFDTWFSSALWPFATLYRPSERAWYPAALVTSARDILHLWITRMIFSGLFFAGKAPFQIVLIHPTILTKDGKRMSKSLGTGIDPLDLIKQHGADALRFGLIWQATQRQDVRFDDTQVIAGRKFANKLWNATRFVLTRAAELPPRAINSVSDRRILGQLRTTQRTVERQLGRYQFAEALQVLYRFTWHNFCDVYLESCKGETTKNNPAVLRRVLTDTLTLLHPFIPFVTEALWSALGYRQPLLLAPWPKQA